jgi:hypothetical protein
METMAFTPQNYAPSNRNETRTFDAAHRSAKLVLMGWNLLAILALALAQPAPDPHREAFKPPVIKEPDEPADAWFFEDPGRNVWCGFNDRRSLEAFAKGVEPPDHGAPGYAFVFMRAGRLSSIILETTSEDAFSSDHYLVSNGRLTELRRTGHYIRDDLITYVLRQDAKGRWKPTAATRDLRAKAHAAGFEDYWMDWSTYSRLEAMPFAKLIAFNGGKVTVKSGCTPTPKDR